MSGYKRIKPWGVGRAWRRSPLPLLQSWGVRVEDAAASFAELPRRDGSASAGGASEGGSARRSVVAEPGRTRSPLPLSFIRFVLWLTMTSR